ncbi:hypothetical protein E8E14_013566 [Neopestalotiopsis sp. 37M]|nr:hypothetical protein E8E14_013566 [Neopestalotiopsis sp. 37M]
MAAADPINSDEHHDGDHDAVSIHHAATTSRGSAPSKAAKPASFYMSLLALGMLSLITSWDATSLAIALPVITSHLEGTTLECFWASISFILGVAITQPIYVSVSDVLGRKQPLYASMILFMIGAVVFATADSMIVLIIGRLIQGLGAGGLDVLEEIILADITTLRERPKYIGLLAVFIAVGTVSGPILGAVFSEFADWRWIGWINLPIVGVAFVLAFFFLRLKPILMPLNEKIRRLDWLGMSMFAFGAAAVSLPLSWANALYPWSSWRTILLLVVGVLVLVVFGLHERTSSLKEALMPRRIFSSRTSNASFIAGLVHGMILYTMLLYLPLFFQAVFLEPPLQAGISTLPVCALVVGFSFVAPIIVEITRRYRLLLVAGWALTTAFLGAWCLVGKDTSRAKAYAFQAMLGVGAGTLFTGIQIPVQASATAANVDDTGLAVGMLVVFRLFGGLVGLAVGSTAFHSAFRAHIYAMSPPLPESARVLEDASQAISFIPTLTTLDVPAASLDALVDVYQKSFQAIWIAMTAVSGLGLLATFFIEELTLEIDEVGRQGLDTST